MVLTITGPVRPPKADVPLVVNTEKATQYEGILEGILDRLPLWRPDRGYFDQINDPIYNAIWGLVFQSFTGERAAECVSTWLLPEEQYMQRIIETFGDEETFTEFVGFKPMEIQGCNINSVWIILRDKKDVAILADMYHELGHRVYPLIQDRYQNELGAYYFMLLAMKKANTELSPHGFSIPEIDFGVQITEDHERALREARRLIETNTPYAHPF